MTIYTGEDIIQLESDELIQRSGPKLKKLRLAVKESELPLLPQGVLPGGWDALGRPWALMVALQIRYHGSPVPTTVPG